jgi:hypothetical protein
MATTVNLRKLLDRKEWEMMTPAPTATAVGTFVVSSSLVNQLQLYVQASTVQYLYRPDEDAWLTVTSGSLGTLAAGSCGAHHPNGPTGTATAGSASTLTTNLTIPGNLAGYKIRITGGPGAGDERTILSNTYGANSVITVSSNFSATITSSSTYLLLTGRFWCLGCSAAAATFKYYDVATNAWTSRSSTNVSATFGTDGRLIATPGSLASFATGTATSGAASTLTNTGKAWVTNAWTNFQIRITGGTGAGQIRTIASNTATVITVSSNWTANPDATSVYSIEGNDDYLYLMGNNAVTLQRYSIAGDSWSTLSPGAARSAAPGAGMSGHWVYAATDPTWTVETTSNQGDRIYSFRGGASTALDYYSISQNTWVSGITYQRLGETFTTGTSYALVNDYLYIQKDSTGRFYRYDIPKQTLDPWSTLLYAQGTAVVGDKTWDTAYVDGGTTLRWIYNLRNTGTELFRCMVI